MAEVLDSGGQMVGCVFAGDVIGYEVDYHLEACAVSACDKLLEFVNTPVDVNGQVGVDVIIVGDGVRAAGFTLDNMRIMAWNAVLGIVGCMSVLDNTGIPYMCGTELAYLL